MIPSITQTVEAVIEQVANEREALQEFYDDNVRLEKENSLLVKQLAQAKRIIAEVQKNGGLFLPGKVQMLISEFMESEKK